MKIAMLSLTTAVRLPGELGVKVAEGMIRWAGQASPSVGTLRAELLVGHQFTSEHWGHSEGRSTSGPAGPAAKQLAAKQLAAADVNQRAHSFRSFQHTAAVHWFHRKQGLASLRFSASSLSQWRHSFE